MSNSPKPQLERMEEGKAFHHAIQNDWLQHAEGVVRTEVEITKPSGRKGRIDVFVDTDDNLAVVVEAKSTNWDRIEFRNVRPNVLRHIRQVWDYLGAIMGPNNDGTPVSPALLYRNKPSDPVKVQLIDELCDQYSVQVAWQQDAA